MPLCTMLPVPFPQTRDDDIFLLHTALITPHDIWDNVLTPCGPILRAFPSPDPLPSRQQLLWVSDHKHVSSFGPNHHCSTIWSASVEP